MKTKSQINKEFVSMWSLFVIATLSIACAIVFSYAHLTGTAMSPLASIVCFGVVTVIASVGYIASLSTYVDQ